MAPSGHAHRVRSPCGLRGASHLLNNPDHIAKKEIKSNVLALVTAFNDKTGPEDPLDALNHKLTSLFGAGPSAAFELFRQLDDCVSRYLCQHLGNSVQFTICFCHLDRQDFQDHSDVWKSQRLASSVVLLLASAEDSISMQQALQFYSPSVYSPLTHDWIQQTPSASLTLAFRRAKTAAIDNGNTTVLGCDLIDTAAFDPRSREATKNYTSFIHCFVLGFGPKGFAIWQAWGDNDLQQGSYSLDEYIRDGHARLRDWNEAEQFVDDFEKLARAKGTWNAKLNKLYKKLFYVDLNQVCAPNGDGLPITPKYKPWIRIQQIENVTTRRVQKFFCHQEESAAPTRI